MEYDDNPKNAGAAERDDRWSLPTIGAQFVKYNKAARGDDSHLWKPRQMFDSKAENPKLRAALEYLGDRLSTHPASRFRPPARPLLEEWLASRREAAHGLFVRADGGYRSWLTKERPPRFTIVEPYHVERETGT